MHTRHALILALILLPAAAWATDAPLIGDAYISSANPSLNFGSLPNLTVGDGNVSLLQFDLSTLPSGVANTGILKATLQLYVNRVGTAGTMDVSPVESSWTESEVTYSTIPAIGTPIGTGIAVSHAGEYVSFDVTAQVQKWIATPASSFGLALSSTGLFYLDSKESTTTSHPAKLDITLAVAPQGDIFVQSSGYLNVAAGPSALPADVNGVYNTAFGAQTLQLANGGPYNTAIGFQALQNTTSGGVNTAVGANALWQNTTGTWNSGFGASALQQNTMGQYNTAVGFYALSANLSGSFNTAIGGYTGYSGAIGSDNIFIGWLAGFNTTSGSYNVDIGNQGVSTDANIIRIGDSSFESRTFIAGIRGSQTGVSNGVEVVIDSNGQLGTINSSRRFKHDITDMGDASSGLMKLRPVTFHYNQGSTDGVERLEYGLVAEEVAGVYPEAVTYTPTGEAETIQYHKINAMMLNEIQKQHRTIEEQAQELNALRERLAVIEKALPPAAH